MKRLSALLLCCLAAVPVAAADPPAPLVNAHAHNDYEHSRPLLDALDHGFASVEADVHLVDGQLLVAHDLEGTQPGRTLEKLYLDPLQERVRRNNGSVYPRPSRFILLIDIKSDAEATYPALRKTLEGYAPMLTSSQDSTTTPGAVTIILSGNRPIQTVRSEAHRLAGIDGRLADLEHLPSTAVMPLISDNWARNFSWKGEGEFPPEERARLRQFVKITHDRGRLIRFWATPDTPAAWSELEAAGVDLINTDDLPGLSRFLRSKE